MAFSTSFTQRAQETTKAGKITQKGTFRRSRSFKVNDFGTSRMLIYDFLLVINTNLPYVARSLCRRLLLDTVIANVHSYGFFNYFYTMRPGNYQSRQKSRKIKAISPFKVIQGHRFWYQSKAHTQLPISD